MSSGPRMVLRHEEVQELQSRGWSSECYYYIAFDQAKEGEGSLSYPQLPQQSTTPVSNPDEHLEVAGLGLTGAFTLFIAGMMPPDDWNHRTPRQSGYWPLFTLYSGSADPPNDYIEFGAVVDGNEGGFRVTYRANGGTPQVVNWPASPDDNIYWSRNSQLLVGLSYGTGTNNDKLILTASLGGEEPRPQDPNGIGFSVTFSSGRNFSTLKFRGIDNEVVTFRWFGGEAIDGTAHTLSGIGERLADLSFLD